MRFLTAIPVYNEAATLLRIVEKDVPGFWEGFGYHNRGDQWLEERYSGD